MMKKQKSFRNRQKKVKSEGITIKMRKIKVILSQFVADSLLIQSQVIKLWFSCTNAVLPF